MKEERRNLIKEYQEKIISYEKHESDLQANEKIETDDDLKMLF